MEKKILEIIKNENRKIPLTDSEIAKLANVSREKVNDVRKKNNIPNSRERLKPYLLKDARKIVEQSYNISHRALMTALNEIGYKISRQVALNIRQQIDSKIVNVEDNNENEDFIDKDIFKSIIGYNKSLKIQISQAQAAVLYPPKGMHTLILGESGVGKSQLAEVMYKFAVHTDNFDNDAPFVTFNCADYAENPQLLLSQLFGYVKGAFTGAEKEKEGIIELVNEGILFLDEIHRLPSEGQEILFTILDKGRYKKLGETNSYRNANLMIIGATSENHNSTLLTTFRRRIPMVIEMPNLEKRTPSERYNLIKYFFNEEAKKIKKEIIVEKNTISMLIAYECAGNVGQLRSDIQVACARALLNAMINKKENLLVRPSDLADHVKIGILNKNLRSSEITKYSNEDLKFKNDGVLIEEQDSRYVMPDWIYKFIEDRTYKLEIEGLNPSEINSVIGREIEKKFEDLSDITNIKDNITRGELRNLVGSKITRVVDSCQNVAKNYFINLEDSFYYTLSIHLSATYERLLNGKKIKNPHLSKIKDKYANEYKVAQILAEIISTELEIEIPEEEIGFIAMYLKTFSGKSVKKTKKVGVVILTHGKVGKAIAEVANKILNTNHAIGVEMLLTESPKVALEKAINAVKQADEGKGCALIVDMGSLVVFGDIITKQTGIPVKVLKRVDTLMALEVLRRALVSDSTLDDVVADLNKDNIKYLNKSNKKYPNHLPKAIVTICMTGEGSAEKIKTFIEGIVNKLGKEVKVISIGLVSPINVDVEIKRIEDKYHILSFVGTINPEIDDIPYISIGNLLNGNGIDKLNNIIKYSDTCSIEDILDDRLIITDIEYNDKNHAIESMVNMLKEYGYVDDEFLLSVFKRETIVPTFIKGNIAIPHGLPQHVKKPVIVIAKLKNDIFWSKDSTINLIFLIAYRNDSKKYFKNFYKVILNSDVIKEIRRCTNSHEIKNVIIDNYKE